MRCRPVVLALALVTGCAGGGEEVRVARNAAVSATGPTDDLAPSQLTAETAVPPDTPPPCEPSVVSIWTAHVQVREGSADAVLRVRNDGDQRCEVDVGGSPLIDPFIEPDVWLDPGGWADLVIGSAAEGCDGTSVVGRAQLDVNGEEDVIETAAVVSCGWQLTAFYPNEVSDRACDELAVAAVAGAVVVRNVGNGTCRLGALESVTGVASAVGVPGVAVPLLAAGDVVAFAVDPPDAAGGGRSARLDFDSGVVLDVELPADARSIVTGPPSPWIGGPGSPITDDPESLLAALDPFGGA